MLKVKAFILTLAIIFSIATTLYTKCTKCHKNISDMGKNHKFSCEACHKSDTQLNSKCPEKNIIKNPSDLKFATKKCGKCHSEDIKRVKNSLMSTNAGIINITRFLWKAQSSPQAVYSTINTAKLKKIPDSTLVDDFLRKVCLRCHINTEGAKRFGEFRSTGCASCHVIYKNNGEKEHKFTKDIPTFQCLHCHNFNRVGLDYAGYFEHDYSNVYDFPVKGKKVKIYGTLQHRLISDVHFRKGFRCTFCHKKDDVMGDGNTYSFKYQQVKVRCIHCHKDKTKHFSKFHKNLECYSCHSLWGAQDYGLNAVREDYPGFFRWKSFSLMNIPSTQKILKNTKNFPNPRAFDYIDRKEKLGVWYILWNFRRWEDPVLGINSRGKISPVRPDYQFIITWIDKNMKVKLDSKKMVFNWNPYVPHTTTKRGRDCYSCHFNLKSQGLGYGMLFKDGKILNTFIYPIEKIVDIKGRPLQNFVYPNASPLKRFTIKLKW